MPDIRRSEDEVKVDIHVGLKLREARTLKNLTQTGLGELVRLTFQQIQKYENGSNRIGASRLWHLSEILELPISYFFAGLDSGKRINADDAEMAETIRRKSLELVRNFYSIEDERVREAAYQLIKGMAKTGR
jgi:transcriptional regulator with XRE-family HTH domain